MHQCPQCNTLVPDERRYCSKCGAMQLISRSPSECEACGRELPGPMHFCKWCGAVQTKYDGANDPAATTALNSPGTVRPTTGNLESPAPANATAQLQPSTTAPVLRQPPEPLEKGVTTGELSPSANALDSSTDASEETLVRPPRAASYEKTAMAAPNFTTMPAPVLRAIPVTAAKKKRNLLPLVAVGVFALAVGTGMAFLLFQHFNRAPARENSTALPVVPVPLPTVGTRSPAPAPSAVNPAIAMLPSPQVIVAAPAPTSSIAPGNTSINTQPPPPAITSQPIVPNSTAAPPAAAPARLPAGAPRKGVGEWSGVVLGSALIEFNGRNQSVAGSAPSLRSAHLSLDNGLPQAPSIVRINKKKGRGQVTVVEQPSADNHYTARVQIGNGKDTAPENYVFDFTWEAAAP